MVDEGKLNEKALIKLPPLHAIMAPIAQLFEQMTGQLFNGVVRLYQKLHQDMFNNQYQVKRAAEITTYCYALLAGISKTQHLIEQQGVEKSNTPLT